MRKKTLLKISFLVIAVIIFSNINGLVYMVLGINAPLSIFILLGCIIISYYLFYDEKIILPHYSMNICLIGYLVVGMASFFFYRFEHAENLDYYNVFRKQVPGIILTYCFYKYTVYEGRKGKLDNVLLISMLMLFFITLTIPFGSFMGLKEVVSYDSVNRESGFFKNPNMAGAHVNYTLALVLFFISNSKGWRVFLLSLVGLPLTLYAAFVTFSKSTMIVAVLICILFLVLNFAYVLKLGRLRRFRFGILLAGIGLGVLYIAPQVPKYFSGLGYSQLNRLSQVQGLLSGEVSTETTTHRIDVWEEGAEIIKGHFLIGFGFGSFARLPKAGFGIHNTYLMILGESGIIPFIALLVSVLSTYYWIVFRIRDPGYKFLALALFIVISIQVFGAAHTGLRNSELLSILGLLYGILKVTSRKSRYKLPKIRLYREKRVEINEASN